MGGVARLSRGVYLPYVNTNHTTLEDTMEFITMTRNAARVWNDHLDAVAALAWAANTAAFEAQAKVVAETYEDCLWMAIDLTARGEAADLTAAVEAIVGDAMPDTFKAEMVRRAEGIKHEAGNLI